MRLQCHTPIPSTPSTSGRSQSAKAPARPVPQTQNRRPSLLVAAEQASTRTLSAVHEALQSITLDPSRTVQAQYSRAPQIKATELLSQLLQSEDPRAAARQNVDSLTEEFFMVSSTYLEMVRTAAAAAAIGGHDTCSFALNTAFVACSQAKKEQNSEVAKQLESALKAAMEEKQKTLRPEIQLLNNLLAVNSRPARKQACPCVSKLPCPGSNSCVSNSVG